MTKSSLVGHACWGAVAVAAFALGSLRERPAAADVGERIPAKSSRSGSAPSAVPGGAIPGSRPERSSSRRVEGSASRARGPEYDSPSAGPMSDEALATLAREAFKSGSPLVRRAAFGRLLESLTAENAVQMREFLKENKAQGDQWRDFHYAWGAIDGKAAMMHSIASKEYDLAHSMAGFASAYPSEARNFLETLPEDVKTDRALMRRSLVSGMADRDTVMATDYVFELAGQGEQRASEYLGIVTGEVMRNEGLEHAVQWSESLPDGPLKGAAMDQVAHTYVERDPVAAAAWAEQFAGQEYAGRVIEEVGDEWSERDPVAAITWLQSLPQGGGQYSGLDSAFGNWGHRDPVAAGERLASMPRSEQRDHAISGYVGSLSHRDPVAAIDWANSIGRDNLRTRALTRAGQALFRRDAETARTWVVSSGLPPEAQEAVLNPPRRR